VQRVRERGVVSSSGPKAQAWLSKSQLQQKKQQGARGEMGGAQINRS
jgi:hypothetical protein